MKIDLYRIANEAMDEESVEVLSSSNFDGRFILPDCPEVIWDANISRGTGAVPYNNDIRYFGFGALMLPSKFLALVADLPEKAQRQTSISYLESVTKTRGWAPPILYVDFDEMSVDGHEGRHRTTLFRKLCGNKPYLVHFKLNRQTQVRARNIDRSMLEKINGGLHKESQTSELGPFVRGPLFSRVFLLSSEFAF